MGIVVQHKPRVVKAFVLFLLLLVGLYTASVALFGSPANRALSQAAADGDVAGVEAALAHGADVNTWWMTTALRRSSWPRSTTT